MRSAVGVYTRSVKNGYVRKSFDIMSAFFDVLGKQASEVPDNYERGELLVDTAMELETNATKGLATDNTLSLARGQVKGRCHRQDCADVFARERTTSTPSTLWTCFLDDEQQTSLDSLNDLYVLVNFRPVLTNKNWRMDCGVAGL